jgi:methylmalonyl-CoA/ethylmalonyl-CoA epimerase
MNFFKKKPLRSSVITQIGFIVRDIQKTSRDFATFLGVDVPKITETEPYSASNAEFRGQPTEGRAKLAFFRFKNISLELIEPIGGPSTWQEFLEKKGEGVHHIALKMKGADQKFIEGTGLGIKLEQKGDYPGGCYKYLNATESLKIMLELLESK